MDGRIVVVGAGFAGVWSALAAKRQIRLKGAAKDLEILVISPEPALTIRPRLYEAKASHMAQPLKPIFESTGIKFFCGAVEKIDPAEQVLDVRSTKGEVTQILYTRLILAAGSAVVRPSKVLGLREHAFDIDTIGSANTLEAHLDSLVAHPPSQARDTIVVCGGGFAGIELAAELPHRLGRDSGFKIVIVESANTLGPELGSGLLPAIEAALCSLGVSLKLGSAVTSIDEEGVIMASGERIPTRTAIWTAGLKATPLTQQIPGTKDAMDRVHVNQYLSAPACKHIFVTGDAAHAYADSIGHLALMSCQHALVLGRVCGHNAASDLLGEPMMPYVQAAYNCCLDLGDWGAVIGAGWEMKMLITGNVAKKVKQYINRTLIYTPTDAEEAIQAADPRVPDSDELFRNMLMTVSPAHI